MNKFVAKFNKFNIWLTILAFALIFVPTTCWIVLDTISLIEGGPSFVKNGTLLGMSVLDLFFIGAWVTFFWHIHVFRNTEYTENGITKPTLRGIRTLRWSEVTSMELDRKNGGCFIYTEKMKWGVSLVMYKNYAELLEYMVNQVKKYRNIT